MPSYHRKYKVCNYIFGFKIHVPLSSSVHGLQSYAQVHGLEQITNTHCNFIPRNCCVIILRHCLLLILPYLAYDSSSLISPTVVSSPGVVSALVEGRLLPVAVHLVQQEVTRPRPVLPHRARLHRAPGGRREEKNCSISSK